MELFGHHALIEHMRNPTAVSRANVLEPRPLLGLEAAPAVALLHLDYAQAALAG